MDYGEALTIHDDAIKRLRDVLPRGRWKEARELAILAEQSLRALVEETKRLERLAEAPVENAAPRAPRTIYAHFPDEP